MADPVAPIRMVGAPGSLPPELQARAAQFALQQQIANAMMAQSMQVEPATINGPSQNPFARSVVNLAPLGKMFQSYQGYKSGQEAADAQQQLAGLGEAIRQGEYQKAMAPREATFHDEANLPGGGPEFIPGTAPPTMRQIAESLIGSSHPANQALGQSILEKQFDIAGKNLFTPANKAEAMSQRGANLRPEAVNRAVGSDPLTGAPTFDTSKLTNEDVMPRMEKTGPTESVTPVNPATIGQPGAKNPAPLIAGRQPEVIKEAEKTAARWTDPEKGILPEGAGKVQTFEKMVPVIGNMLKLTEGITTGSPAAEWIQKVRQMAVQFGLANPETAGQITNFQTLMKYAMGPAIEQAKSLTSRPSQLEFLKTLEASAADPNITPEAARNIFRNFLVTGLNEISQHNKNLKQAGQNPTVAPNLGEYTVPGLEGPEGEERLLASVMNQTGQSMNFERMPNGVWRDRKVLENVPGSAEAKTAAAARGPTKVVGGKTYYKHPDGHWDTEPQP